MGEGEGVRVCEEWTVRGGICERVYVYVLSGWYVSVQPYTRSSPTRKVLVEVCDESRADKSSF